MTKFMDRDFLLKTETARELYHGIAETLPICDFHCHIPAQQIAELHDHRLRARRVATPFVTDPGAAIEITNVTA